MELFYFMSFSAVAVFFLLLIATCLPYTVLKGCCVNASKFTVSILGCASCGVFIATCFLGLVPHVRHQEMELRSNTTITSIYEYIPTTDQLTVLGFVIILIVEQIIHAIGHSIGHSHSSRTTTDEPQTTIKMRKFLDEDGDDNVPLVEVDPGDEESDDIIFRHGPNSPSRSSCPENVATTMNIRVWFLLLGMSVHSFFEGVALGVQNDKHAFYQILIAVLFHELLCCISYGIQLAKHNASSRYAWISSVFLSATIPVGMVLATMIDGIENETWQRLGRYWLEGLAAGTFVHVALVELLPMELHGDEEGGGHGHSHNLIVDSTSSHSHSHSSTSKWSSLIKSLFVAGGILLFVVFKAMIGTHH